MKEITLKEWSAYLPYGLICEVKDQGGIETDTLFGVYDSCELLFHNIVEFYQGFESVKPILYDLSWLTREITHEGETFVPIEKLLDIESEANWSASDCLLTEIGVGEYWVKLKGNEKSFVFGFNSDIQYFYKHNQFGENQSVKHQLELFNKLFEWKFNVFSLPDELIVRVTEDFNPYK